MFMEVPLALAGLLAPLVFLATVTGLVAVWAWMGWDWFTTRRRARR